MRPTNAIYTADRTVIDNTVLIEQTLDLFSHSVDNHDFTLLDSVFSLDAVANFATPAGFVDGLPAIKALLQKVLTGTVSQHALSTPIIRVASDQSTTASSSTYLQGTFFGQGNLTGQVLRTYGQ